MSINKCALGKGSLSALGLLAIRMAEEALRLTLGKFSVICFDIAEGSVRKNFIRDDTYVCDVDIVATIYVDKEIIARIRCFMSARGESFQWNPCTVNLEVCGGIHDGRRWMIFGRETGGQRILGEPMLVGLEE